jgi:hypothetical protein
MSLRKQWHRPGLVEQWIGKCGCLARTRRRRGRRRIWPANWTTTRPISIWLAAAPAGFANRAINRGRVKLLMVVPSRTRGRRLGGAGSGKVAPAVTIGGAGAELSGRPRHDPIESAGRGRLWRVCALAFQAG